MKNIDFTVPEFTKLMREYSNLTTATPVNPSCWRAMKRILVQNKRIVRVNIKDNYIRFYEGGDFPGDSWNVVFTPGLSAFIEWLLAKKNMTTPTCYAANTTASSLFDGCQVYTSKIDIDANNLNSNTIKNDYSCVINAYNPLDTYRQFINVKVEEKEKKSMFNFDFGKITSDKVRFSMYGIAVKNVDGRYVAYDVKTHSVMDVEILNMPCGDMLYKMPVAIKDIAVGDVVIHNKVPMFVIEVHDSTLKVVDIHEGTEKEIYLTKSPFGFNFATKVVSLIDFTGKADADNPFGNMLPFMLLSDDSKMDDMLPLAFLMKDGKMDTSNPMMMYFLMKDNTNIKDMLPLMLMSNG